MKLSFNLLFQIAALFVQLANIISGWLPPKYQPVLALGVGLCQVLVSWRAQHFNPDGTSAEKPYDPTGSGMFLPRRQNEPQPYYRPEEKPKPKDIFKGVRDGLWNKFRKVTAEVEPAVKIASVVAPGRAGDIARIVEKVISNADDPTNIGALRQLANEIVELKMRVDHLEQVITRRQ